jgi:hypothetical protein
MNLAFGDAVAPREGEPGFNGDEVILQPPREPGERLDPAVYGLGHPGLQVCTPALPDHGQKRVTQPIRPRDVRFYLAELLDVDLRVLGPLRNGTDEGERHGTG